MLVFRKLEKTTVYNRAWRYDTPRDFVETLFFQTYVLDYTVQMNPKDGD